MATTQANQAIYDRLNGMQQFHPGNVTLLTDWSIEPGDVIQVQSGTDANGDAVFSPMPVYQLDLTWRGAVTAEVQATGNEKRPPLSALRRQNYSYGHGISQAQKTANEAVDEVVYISDFTKTDRGIGMLAQAIGVKIDEDTGLPAKDEHGEYIFDGVNGATLTGTLSVQAWSVIAEVQQARGNSQTLGSALSLKADTATLISAINSASGTIASGKVQVQPGNVLIEAINGADGTVTINAGKIDLQGYVTATELAAGTITAISAGSGSVTAGSIVATDATLTNITSAGDTTIDALYLGNSGGTANWLVTADNLVKSLAITPPASGSNDYTLTWTTADGVPHTLTFSRAASGVSVSWSGTTGTVTVQPQNQQFSITYDGPSSASVDAITITNTPVTGTLYTGSGGTRYGQADLDLAAWHNNEDETQTQLKAQTAQLRMNIESILSSAESTAAANAKSTALAGVKLSGWQLNSSSHDAENIVRDADNNDLKTVSLPSNWDISVGAFNASGSATITVRPVIGGTNGTQVATGTIADSNLKPENIKSGVTIFGKTGTYTGSGSGDTDTGWNAAADYLSDHLVAPSSPDGAYSILGPLAGGYGDTGTVKTLYLVDDSLHSRMLLKDVNSLSSGNTFASSTYVATPEEGQTYEDGWADALATVELVRSPDTSSPSYSQTVNVTAKAKATPTAASKTAISGASTSITAPDAPSGTVTVTGISKHGNAWFSSNKKTVYFNARASMSDGSYSSDYEVSCDVTETYNAGVSGVSVGAGSVQSKSSAYSGGIAKSLNAAYKYHRIPITINGTEKTYIDITLLGV